MNYPHFIKFTLIALFALIGISVAAQEKTPPAKSKTTSTAYSGDEISADAKARFDEQRKSSQERFEAQIAAPKEPAKSKKKKEKPEKAKKEKSVKVLGQEVIEVKSAPTAAVVKDNGFRQAELKPDKESIVRGVRVSASEPIINITPERARAEAIRKAKEAALVRVVGEDISASTTIVDHGGLDGASLARISTIGTRGGVIALEVIRDTPVVDANGVGRYEVEIVVDVKIYPKQTTAGISFDLAGTRYGYTHGERLTFSVTPSDSCYIYIFLFDSKNEGTLLVPSRYEPQNLLTQGAPTAFPSSRAIQYTLTLDNPISTEETNTLLVVAFRHQMPITPQVYADIEQTLCWINSIDLGDRSQDVEVVPIKVYQKK